MSTSSKEAGSSHRRGETGPCPTKLLDTDLDAAWEILSPGGHSALTKSQVLDSLARFFPAISAREVRELVGPGNLSIEKLQKLLFSKDMPEFDANEEAFKILDQYQTGYVEMNVLRRLLLQMPGVDNIDDADMELLHKLVDEDGDGRISLKDFAQLGSWVPEKEVANEQIRKILAARGLQH